MTIYEKNRLIWKRFPRKKLAGATGLEPATSGVTGRRSKPTELRPRAKDIFYAGLPVYNKSTLKPEKQADLIIITFVAMPLLPAKQAAGPIGMVKGYVPDVLVL